jgi:murein DD-endopeptidase MepM/ murein hydrolase activator NlpD
MVDRNPLGQSQDPQRLVSNVTPVAITPAQYGVDTSLATGMAKASQFLLQAAGVGTQIANNKQREYEALLKDQGTAIARAKRDLIAPELGKNADDISVVTNQQDELTKKLNKDLDIPASQIKPWNQQESIQKSKDKDSLSQVTSNLKGLQNKKAQLEAAYSYIPKGTVAAKAYFDTKAISDLGDASLNLKAAIAQNPMMTPEQVNSLVQGLKSSYIKDYLQNGATDAAEYFSKGFDTVANDIKETNYLQAIFQVKDNASIAGRLQILKAVQNTTSTTPAQIVSEVVPAGLQKPVTGIMPIDGQITGTFGEKRANRPPGYQHQGLDLAQKAGTPVKVAVSGTVTKVGYIAGYGNVVFIKTVDGKETRYAHLESSNLTVGQKVGKGVVLGKVGSTGKATGSHLHFEVRDNGRAIDPVAYIKNLNIPVQSKTTAMVATGNAVVETAKTATPSTQQSLRNNAVVQGLSQQFNLYGAKDGSKPVLDIIDDVFKQTIDSGVSSDRAYDILNQFIKTAEENVINANNKDPNSSDVSTAILTLRHLEKYKSDNAMTKFSTYEIAKANRKVQEREINNTQNSARDFQFFSEYTTLVSGGMNPGIALAQVSSKLGQPSKALMSQISLYQQGNNTAYERQKAADKALENKAEDKARLDRAAQTELDSEALKYINDASGAVFRTLGAENTDSVAQGNYKEEARRLVLKKHIPGKQALAEVVNKYKKTQSKAQSPTTNSGGSNKASTVKKSNSQLATGL